MQIQEPLSEMHTLSWLGAAYFIIAVKARPWDRSSFLSYFNQYLSYWVPLKAAEEYSPAVGDESSSTHVRMKYEFVTCANAVLFHLY